MKNFILNFLIVLLFFGGLGIMLYPSFSNWINEKNQSSVIANYKKVVDNVEVERRAMELEKAEEYNRNLSSLLSDPDYIEIDESPEYLDTLDISGNGVMGVIDIDRIDVHLPIYHGTSDSVLQVGAGHLPETSLPVGGKSTHAVISAHTGLPSAKLFTDLDELEIGDQFVITVLGRELIYEVDQIVVAEPYETSYAAVVSGKDYVTLLTCTPYGINTHRLLVRGERITIEEAEEEDLFAETDAVFLDKMLLIPFTVIPVDIIYLLLKNAKTDKKRRKEAKES